MGRRDTFYFSHDYTARTDDKIRQLIRRHGMLGYGVFWAIIEDLYNNANAMRLDSECIAYDLRVDESVVKSVINDFDLFNTDGGILSSNSVQRRLEERKEKSDKARESASYRWNKSKKMRTQCERIDSECESNAIKERKGKDIKDSVHIETYSFDDFWSDYDKKVGRKTVVSIWKKLNDEAKLEIKRHLPIYKKATPDKIYRLNPQTYLNREAWNDEVIEKTHTHEQPSKTFKRF